MLSEFAILCCLAVAAICSLHARRLGRAQARPFRLLRTQGRLGLVAPVSCATAAAGILNHAQFAASSERLAAHHAQVAVFETRGAIHPGIDDRVQFLARYLLNRKKSTG